VMDILDLEPWIGERSALGRTWWRARRIVALFLDVAYLYINLGVNSMTGECSSCGDKDVVFLVNKCSILDPE
jgi:hypothetical protein